MSNLILSENETPVNPEWGDGSLAAILWASQQRCASPLAKLVLSRVADCAGMKAEWGVYIGVLADWCCAGSDETAEAIDALGADGLLHVFLNDNFVHVALPWWQEPKIPVKTTFVKTAMRREMWDTQGGACWYCGCNLSCDHLRTVDADDNLVDPEGYAPCEIEHQTPRTRGGGDARANLVLACRTCNRTKRDKTVDEYRSYLSSRVGAAVVFHGERQ